MSMGPAPDSHASSRASLPAALQLQLVELKNGETYNGNLVSVDIFMNLQLSDVICTSKVSAHSS